MRLLSILFFTCCVNFIASAQLINQWRRAANVEPFDNKRCYEMPNGNILLARMDESNGIGDGNDLLMCYSPEGDLLWTYGDITDQNLTSSNYVDIDFDSNSNIYLAGTYFPFSALYPKSEVTKLSSDGELQWVSDFTQQSDWSESAFQIEITEDDRIFLLVRLYYQALDTIIPYFAEMDSNGEILTLIADPEYQIGFSELFDFNDGFLYVVESSFITKLDYDGEVVWSQNFDFGEQYYTSFAYEGAEEVVKFKNGKIYLCLGLNDFNTNVMSLGLAVVNTNGTLEQAIPYNILPDMENLYFTYSKFLKMDSNDNIYVTGTLYYGEGGIVRSGVPHTGANRGGKGGSTFSGTFVVKFNSSLEQQWVSTYLENDIDGVHFPFGTFLNNNQITVVYNQGLFESNVQKIVQYDSSSGNISWEHLDTSTEVFETTRVASSLYTTDGHLYTCGSGFSEIDFVNVAGIYLYKYAFDNVGLSDALEVGIVRAFPNPATEQISIAGLELGSYLKCYNSAGQLCFNERITSPQLLIDLHTWAPGIYQFAVVGSTTKSITVVKQ